jgi:hypothetical protein
MKLTLDWNCVIEVEEQQAQSDEVLELVWRHRSGHAEVALLAASASENTKSKIFPGNAKIFKERINALGWGDLPLVKMPGVSGLSYFDFAYYVGDGAEYERKMSALWSVIAPKVSRNLSDHLTNGQSLRDGAIQSPQLAKWRNSWCDVTSAYCHIHAGRDVFVTNNTRDFQSHADELAKLGMLKIATPADAIRLLDAGI